MTALPVRNLTARVTGLALLAGIVLAACAPATPPPATAVPPTSAPATDPFVEEAKRIATAATAPYTTWDGPPAGRRRRPASSSSTSPPT